MAYDVDRLLTMSQEELDALFTASPAGEIPDGEAEGTAIVAPGTRYSPTVARFISNFAWQGKVFDAKKGVLRNKILPFGLNAIIAKVYKDGELARRQGVHRPRLFRHLAAGAVDPRRDPRDRARASTSARSTGASSG